ncbi:MAG: thioredoxin [Planctomycetota bacterium]|nr:thioredoxin [Planctomycetota bacterium]
MRARTTTAKPHSTSMSNATDVTDTTWDAAVTQSTTPVLVDFWASWCGPCKAMSPWVDKLAQEFQGRLKVVKLNTEDNPEVPSRYGISAIPTFLLIKNGSVVKQVVGQMPYDKLKAAVEPHLS